MPDRPTSSEEQLCGSGEPLGPAVDPPASLPLLEPHSLFGVCLFGYDEVLQLHVHTQLLLPHWSHRCTAATCLTLSLIFEQFTFIDPVCSRLGHIPRGVNHVK